MATERSTPSRMRRMYGVGSTAMTSAPAAAACMVPAPTPAPMSTSRSPGSGSIRPTTASLIADLHICGSQRRYRSAPLIP